MNKIIKLLKVMILNSFIYKKNVFGVKNFSENKAIIRNWIQEGKPIPPPEAYKYLTIINYAKIYNLKILIETGTYVGGTIKATKKFFKRIYSIEIDKDLFNLAKKEFQEDKNIYLLNGDSSKLLPELLKELEESCVFWLDAHYSGKNTSRGDKETPIFEELKAISKANNQKNIILIDDARLFNGTNDYPTIDNLKNFITKYFPHTTFEVRDDIIRISY